MRKLTGLLGFLAVVLLSACGGGGGSPGTTQEQYSITLRADSTSLPINIAGAGPGMGVGAPYTTTLYVSGYAGGKPIPDGADGVFSCDMKSNLQSGALYYLDGDSSHETQTTDPSTGDTITVPTAYRSITLGSNAGGNSFHFHAGNQVGTVRITCTVTDPRDSRPYSASVDITVGAATGLPASIQAIAQAPGSLGVQGNIANLRTSIDTQVLAWDDANQPVPNPSMANLQVEIVGGNAASGARLLSGAISGASIQVKTQGGVGLFALSSGSSTGVILLKLTMDRADNNVANGIQDPVQQFYPVQVFDAVDHGLLAIDSRTTMVTATQDLPSAGALAAMGGVYPYTWRAVSQLPGGMSLDANGVISGTPKAQGTYMVQVRVTDQLNNTATAIVTIEVAPPPTAP